MKKPLVQTSGIARIAASCLSLQERNRENNVILLIVIIMSVNVVCTNDQLLGTTDLHKLFNAEQIIMILSIVALCPGTLGLTKSIGMQLMSMENFCLVAPITLSM